MSFVKSPPDKKKSAKQRVLGGVGQMARHLLVCARHLGEGHLDQIITLAVMSRTGFVAVLEWDVDDVTIGVEIQSFDDCEAVAGRDRDRVALSRVQIHLGLMPHWREEGAFGAKLEERGDGPEAFFLGWGPGELETDCRGHVHARATNHRRRKCFDVHEAGRFHSGLLQRGGMVIGLFFL